MFLARICQMFRWSSGVLPQLSLFMREAGFVCRPSDWPCGSCSLRPMPPSPIAHTTHPVPLLFRHTIRYPSKPGNTLAVVFVPHLSRLGKYWNQVLHFLKIPIVSKTLKPTFVGYENRHVLGFVCFFYQGDEIGESEREENIDSVLLLLNRSQLLVVALLFEKVVDQTLLLVPAPTPWQARAEREKTLPGQVWNNAHELTGVEQSEQEQRD